LSIEYPVLKGHAIYPAVVFDVLAGRYERRTGEGCVSAAVRPVSSGLVVPPQRHALAAAGQLTPQSKQGNLSPVAPVGKCNACLQELQFTTNVAASV